jgi:hypothetical protein
MVFMVKMNQRNLRMAKKKVNKKPTRTTAQKISNEQKELILKLMNSSNEVLRDVLEVGSAMANDCLETQSAINKLAKEFNFSQEHYWSEWK